MAMKFDHKWKKLPLPRFTYSQLYVIWKKGEDMLVYRIWIKYKEIAFGQGPEIRWLHVSKEALQKKKKLLNSYCSGRWKVEALNIIQSL